MTRPHRQQGTAGDGDRAPVEEVVQSRPEPRQLRRLPRVVAAAVRLVWEADRRGVSVVAGLQLVQAAATAAQVVAAGSVLRAVVVAAGELHAGDVAYPPAGSCCPRRRRPRRRRPRRRAAHVPRRRHTAALQPARPVAARRGRVPSPAGRSRRRCG